MMRVPGEMINGLLVTVSNGDNQIQLRVDTSADIDTAVDFLEKEFKKRARIKLDPTKDKINLSNNEV